MKIRNIIKRKSQPEQISELKFETEMYLQALGEYQAIASHNPIQRAIHKIAMSNFLSTLNTQISRGGLLKTVPGLRVIRFILAKKIAEARL